MHILATLVSVLVLVLSFGVMAWTMASHRAQVVAALLGRSPVALKQAALDGVTFLEVVPRRAHPCANLLAFQPLSPLRAEPLPLAA
jgi:hypothetical protein